MSITKKELDGLACTCGSRYSVEVVEADTLGSNPPSVHRRSSCDGRDLRSSPLIHAVCRKNTTTSTSRSTILKLLSTSELFGSRGLPQCRAELRPSSQTNEVLLVHAAYLQLDDQ